MTVPTEVFSPGQLLGGKYRLERILGQGGMGAVWSAENVDIGRKVAIKVLHPHLAADPAVLARFRKEARAAASIGHPGIVDILDLGELASGEAYLVMQQLQGETLGARLERAGALDVAAAVWIAGEILDAIDAAHARGIVHRDLKPDNIFLAEAPSRSVKVLDFGISRFHGDENPILTKTGAVLGTPAYMSPEQARGAREVGPAADLYAIGALLYEMLAGAPAFDGQTYNEILAKILTEEKVPIGQKRPDLPEPLQRFVDRMMAKLPEERPASAREAKRALHQASGLEEASEPPTLPPIPLTGGVTGVRPAVTDPALEATIVRPESRASRSANVALSPAGATPVPVAAAAPRRPARRALAVSIAAAVLGGAAAGARVATLTFFAGLQGLVAGAVIGAVAALPRRGERFRFGWAVALSLAAGVVFLGAQCFAADLMKPLVVTGGWLAGMLRGESREWVYARDPRGGMLGLSGGDALFVGTLLDAALAAGACLAVQRMLLPRSLACEDDRSHRRATAVLVLASVGAALTMATVLSVCVAGLLRR